MHLNEGISYVIFFIIGAKWRNIFVTNSIFSSDITKYRKTKLIYGIYKDIDNTRTWADHKKNKKINNSSTSAIIFLSISQVQLVSNPDSVVGRRREHKQRLLSFSAVMKIRYRRLCVFM